MGSVPMIHKLQVYTIFCFVSYNDNEIEEHQKANKHQPTKLLQKSKKL